MVMRPPAAAVLTSTNAADQPATRHRSFGARVRRGTAANIIRQLLNIVGQLLLVPILLKFWGGEMFGQWQMLTAGAAYFALLNVGFQTYATNRMNQHYSRNEMVEFNRTLHSSLFLAVVLALTGITLAVAIALVLPTGTWLKSATANGHAIIALLLMWHAASQINGVLGGTYRAVGEYSRDIFFANVHYCCHVVVIAVAAVAGGHLLAASAAQLVLLAVMTGVIWHDLKRRHPQVALGIRQRDLRLARSFIAPGALFLLIQFSMLVSIQGSTLVVGAVAGAASVAVFVTIRTLVNVIPQVINSVGQSLWPEFTALEASGRLTILADIHRLLTRLSVWLAVCGAVVLHSVGADVISLWTRNRLEYDSGLMTALLALQLTASWYLPSSLVIASSNRHRPLAVCQSAVVPGLLLGYLLAGTWGAAGVVFGLVAADAATSAWYVPLAACRLLGCNAFRLFGETLLRGIGTGLLLSALSYVVSVALADSAAIGRVLVLVGTIGIAGVLVFFIAWLTPSDKARLRSLLPSQVQLPVNNC
jgi:O-antigen/teichoic acid export membrane protein